MTIELVVTVPNMRVAEIVKMDIERKTYHTVEIRERHEDAPGR